MFDIEPFDIFPFDIILPFDIEPFDIELFDIILPFDIEPLLIEPLLIEPFDIEPLLLIEPLFDIFDMFDMFDIMLLFILFAFELVFTSAFVQAIPNAPITKTAERAKVFFIEILSPVFFKDYIYISNCIFTQLCPNIYFWNIGQYKILFGYSQLKNRQKPRYCKKNLSIFQKFWGFKYRF